jgi:hypothetical protein
MISFSSSKQPPCSIPFFFSIPSYGQAGLLLELATVDNPGLDGCPDRAITASSFLDGHDSPHRLLICNLAKDNVLAVKPGGLFRGNEELGSIATENKNAGKSA